MIDPNPIPDQHREEYEERAGIIQYCGGYSRADSETRALRLLRDKYPEDFASQTELKL